MKRLLICLLALLLVLPALAETAEEAQTAMPECWATAYGRLTDFLQAWSVNNHEAMLAVCAPSWKEAQSSPELMMFMLAGNRTAKAWSIGDETREGEDKLYAATILLDSNSGSEPQWYSFTFRVVREDGVRYVDPTCIAEGEKADEPAHYVTAKEIGVEPSADLASPVPADDEWWVDAGYPAYWAEHNARFAEFMALWAARDVDGVLTLLPSGWQPDSDNPWWTLQQMFYIYVPDSYRIQQVTVAEDGKRVTYSVRIVFATPTHELQTVYSDIIMRWTDGGWCVDPQTVPAARALFVEE